MSNPIFTNQQTIAKICASLIMPGIKRSSSLNYKNMSSNKRIKVENNQRNSLLNNQKSPVENLPPEVLETIFSDLPIVDKCNVVLTSQHFRNVGSAPALWSKMGANKKKILIDGLSELLNIKRFEKQQRLDISNFDLNSMNWGKLLRDMCNSKIKELDLSQVDLTILDDKLNIIIPGLSKLNVSKTWIYTEQIESILVSIISSHTMEELNLDYVDLTEVKPDLLARAVSVLKKVNLKDTLLPIDSCIEVMEKCLETSNLRHVNFEGVNLSEVPCELIAQFVEKLHSVNLQDTNLTPDQRSELLKVVKNSKMLKDDDDLMKLLLGLPASFKGTNTTYHTFGWFFHEENDCEFFSDRDCFNGC